MNKLVGVSENCSGRFGARFSMWRDNDRNLSRKIGVACFGGLSEPEATQEKRLLNIAWLGSQKCGYQKRGLPRRSVKSPWRPTSENRERILPMYESADSGVKVMLHGTIFNDNF